MSADGHWTKGLECLLWPFALVTSPKHQPFPTVGEFDLVLLELIIQNRYSMR